MRVTWFTLESLGALVRRHRIDNTVTKVVGRIVRCDLVVVDDIGILPVPSDAAERLYRLVDAAYERRSVAISSNLHPAGFDDLMPKTLAIAIVDRLLHDAHVCVTGGESVRLAQASAGLGVVPLTTSEPPRRTAPRRNGLATGEAATGTATTGDDAGVLEVATPSHRGSTGPATARV